MNETASNRDTQAESLRLLWRQAAGSARLAMAAALLSLLVLAAYDPSGWLIAWYAATSLVAFVRIRLHARFEAVYHDQCACCRWERYHLWTGMLSGLCWGLLGAQPIEQLPLALQSTTLLGPLLIATAALGAYAIRLNHYRAFLVSLFLALLASYTWRHGPQALPAWGIVGLFGLLLETTARRYHETLMETLATKHKVEHAHQELEEANRHLIQQHETMLQEEHIARHVFEQLTNANLDPADGVHTWNQPMGRLSGDLVQVAQVPDGSVYLFLGDFTGHGLPAALGAVPAATVFSTMARKGLPVEVIARELNTKLHSLLPTGYFCCAAVMRLSPARDRLCLWSGGLPPVLVQQRQGGLLEIPSANLPLGVVGDAEFSDTCTELLLQPGDRVFVYTDGLTEAQNHEGEMWGGDRLRRLLADTAAEGSMLERLKEEILDFTNLAPASDDISLIEIVAGCGKDEEAVA